MTFFETPLGEALRRALDSGKTDAIGERVAEILTPVWNGTLSAEWVQEIVVALQRDARFEHAVAVGDAAIATGQATIETRRRYCQALIEIGALHAAELELTRLIASGEPSARERGEALGLMGRLRKQRFVASENADDLTSAIAAYAEAFAGATDPAWHGVNLLALMHRADADGVSLPAELPDPRNLADRVLHHATLAPPNQRGIWDRATEVETLFALGDVEAARQAAHDLSASDSASAFQLGSLRRQFIEIWRLDSADPILLALSNRLLEHGRKAVVDLPESEMELERIFGTALPIGYNTLALGLRCAQSVCKITDANGEGWGTGFLLHASHISDQLGDKTILATNAHVVSSERGVGQLYPDEAEGRFDVTKGTDGHPLVLRGLREMWTSRPDVCDITLLEFDQGDPALEQPIDAARHLPVVEEGAFVYVIGHPAGAGLKFSIRGNDLLAYDEAETKIHYTAPTEPGSSGSPVFSPQWKLIAIHHAGSSKMRRIDGSAGSYEANEGITLEAIRKEYARRPPGTADAE
jgi:hypothetical protein